MHFNKWQICFVLIENDSLYIHDLMIYKRCFLNKDFFRERKGGRNIIDERNHTLMRGTSMCGCLLRAPHWGLGPQPRHKPWLGIEPAIVWFTVQRSIHWATPVRAGVKFCVSIFEGAKEFFDPTIQTCLENWSKLPLVKFAPSSFTF